MFSFLQPEDHKEISNALKSMEELNINNFNGQSYGYIVYRKKLPIKQGAVLSMRGRPRDLLHVILSSIFIYIYICWLFFYFLLSINPECITSTFFIGIG